MHERVTRAGVDVTPADDEPLGRPVESASEGAIGEPVAMELTRFTRNCGDGQASDAETVWTSP